MWYNNQLHQRNEETSQHAKAEAFFLTRRAGIPDPCWRAEDQALTEARPITVGTPGSLTSLHVGRKQHTSHDGPNAWLAGIQAGTLCFRHQELAA